MTGESLRLLLLLPLLLPPLRLRNPGVAEEAPERVKKKRKKKEIQFIFANKNHVYIYKCRAVAKRESLLASSNPVNSCLITLEDVFLENEKWQ